MNLHVLLKHVTGDVESLEVFCMQIADLVEMKGKEAEYERRFVYTCRRLIDLSLLWIYMPAIDRSLECLQVRGRFEAR